MKKFCALLLVLLVLVLFVPWTAAACDTLAIGSQCYAQPLRQKIVRVEKYYAAPIVIERIRDVPVYVERQRFVEVEKQRFSDRYVERQRSPKPLRSTLDRLLNPPVRRERVVERSRSY